MGKLNRREMVMGAAAAGVTIAVATNRLGASAQDPFTMAPATPIALGPSTPPELETYKADWPVPLQNITGHRAAVDSAINASNVTTLGRQWAIPITTGGVTGTPIVAGDVVYFQDMVSNVYAVNRADGTSIWSKEYTVSTLGPNGITLAYGRLFFVLGDTGEVVSLNAADGSDVWRVQLENNPSEGLLMAPTVYDNTVYVSTCPGSFEEGWYDGGGKGILYALDASTGRTLWQWDTTTDNLWGNARANSGGGLWYPPTIDENGNLYFGTGNPAPWSGTEEYPNGSSRPGDNLYTSSMVSLDAATGSLRWYIQAKRHDLFDLDFQNSPVLTTLTIGDKDVNVAIGSGKTGTVIAADRDSGAMLWKIAVGKHQNDELQALPTDDPIEVYPGALGGVEVPMAYQDGVLYLAVSNYSSWYTATGFDATLGNITKSNGEIIAVDAATGGVIWNASVPSMPLGAVVVVNDIVLTAGLEGIVRAFNKADGTEIWNFQLASGVNAPISVAGDQVFVAAAGAFIPVAGQFADGEQPAVNPELVAFTLGVGGGTVPEATPATTGEQPAASPTAAAEQVAATPTDDGGKLALTVIAIDLAFNDKLIEIPADTDVEFTLKNEGAVNHDFVIAEHADSGNVLGGQSSTFTVNVPAGEYQFFCSVPGHSEAGMVGKLVAK